MQEPELPDGQTKPDGKTKPEEGLEAHLQAFADAVQNEDVEAENAAIMDFWQKLAETDREPSPWLQAMTEAHQCEAAFDWKGAENAYLRATTAEDNTNLQSKAYDSLASLYYLLGRDDPALEATRQANRLALIDPLNVLVVSAFVSEAGCCLRAGDITQAEQALNEAFARLAKGPMDHLLRVYVLVQRANYSIKSQDLGAAQSDLAAAWPLLEPHAEFFFAAGWQGAFAFWWATTASLKEGEGNAWKAMKARKEVVARRRIIAQLPQLEGPYKHNNLAVALRDFGKSLRSVDNDLAADVFKESHMIRRSIGLAPLDES